ncbi:MAG: cation diffusion facilitator family transporter [Vampirovibrionales bacterium]|nr:cation diffusion facilitator family transporter [Vampirovibrionales bacterium]
MNLPESQSEPPSADEDSRQTKVASFSPMPVLTSPRVEVGLNGSEGKTLKFSFGQRRESIYRHATGAVIVAMVMNLVIGAIKLVVATVFSASASLFSEGLHSLADALNSMTLLVGIVLGKRQPDRTHPFGYGLETNLWALFASFALLVSALWAVWQGVEKLRTPEPLMHEAWALSVLGVSLLLETFAILTACRAVAEELDLMPTNPLNQIILGYQNIHRVLAPTTRFVLYEDSLAFVGTVVAMVAIALSAGLGSLIGIPGQYAHVPDAIGSIIIGSLLFILAVSLFRYNRSFLTGSAAAPNVEAQIRTLVNSIYGVSEITDLKTIDRGLAGLIVHMSVEVDPDTQVKDVDDLTEHIKHKLQERMANIDQVFIEVLADESEDDWQARFDKLIAEGQEKSILRPREAAMLQNLVEFSETQAQDVMVPRIDVIAVDLDSSLSEVAQVMIDSGHSRLPVYEEQLDNLVGVIHARDVFHEITSKGLNPLEGANEPVLLKDLVRDVELFPENKPLSDLLEDFKRQKIQMAAVADEHGGFAGLITLEDLLEQIVGDLWDEHDVQAPLFLQTSAQTLIINGKCWIEELNEKFALNLPDDDFNTVGGFVFGTLGREPEAGDVVTFEDLVLTVTEADGPRVVTVKIESPTPFTKPLEILETGS